MTASATPMAAPAPTLPAGPSTAGGAGTGTAATTNASAAFAALMGAMFGDQDSLAAQLLAGAKPGAKTEGAQPPAATPEAPADPTAQAQTLAGAFVIVPPVLVDQAQVAADGQAAPTPTAAAAAPQPGVEAGAASAPAAAVVAENADAPQATDAATGRPPAPASEAQTLALAKPLPETSQAPAVVQAATANAAPPAAEALARKVTAGENAATTSDAATAPVDAPAEAAPAKAPGAAAATGGEASPDDGQANTEAKTAKPDMAVREGAAERKEPPAGPPPHAQAAAHAGAASAAPAATPVRGAPETVAHLAAQIAKHLEGRSTQFDIQLTPAGLGHVSVRVEISAHGQLTAAMGFDNPNAAAEVRNRAAELARALEQAGFDVSAGLSFDVAGDQGRPGQGMAQQRDDNANAWRGRAFQAALDTAGETAEAAVAGALNLQRRSLAGVDIRI